MFYENDMTESIWVQITPVWYIKSVSTILVSCIYHPAWADQNGNLLLYEHIQGNIDGFLTQHSMV